LDAPSGLFGLQTIPRNSAPPESQPPQPAGKPYSVRRVNNVPLVIGFCLVAAFVAIVFFGGFVKQ
jgi:hypothetical protein